MIGSRSCAQAMLFGAGIRSTTSGCAFFAGENLKDAGGHSPFGQRKISPVLPNLRLPIDASSVALCDAFGRVSFGQKALAASRA